MGKIVSFLGGVAVVVVGVWVATAVGNPVASLTKKKAA